MAARLGADDSTAAADRPGPTVSRGCLWGCGAAGGLLLIALLAAAAALVWSDHTAREGYNGAPARDEAWIFRELPTGASRAEVLEALARHGVTNVGSYDSTKEVIGLQEFDPLFGNCRVELAFGFDENWLLQAHAIRVHPCIYPWSTVS